MIDVEKFIRAMKPSAMPRWRSGYVGWENGRLDKFFAWGEVHMCGHLCRWLETIVLFERLMNARTKKICACLGHGGIAAMRCLSMGPHGSQEWMVIEGLRRRSC